MSKDPSDEPIYIRYGGRVTATDFIGWPVYGLISGIALIPAVPRAVAWCFIAVGIFATASLTLAWYNVTDERAWVEGSRIQRPLMLGAFVVGQMMTFASTFYVISRGSPHAFSEPLIPASAIYFSVTAWTTTGFGDIYAVAPATRLLVSAELVLAVLTVVIVLSTAVSKAFASRPRSSISVLENLDDNAATEPDTAGSD